MKKLELRVVNLLVQNHTVGKWKKWNLISGFKLGIFCMLTWILSSPSSPWFVPWRIRLRYFVNVLPCPRLPIVFCQWEALAAYWLGEVRSGYLSPTSLPTGASSEGHSAGLLISFSHLLLQASLLLPFWPRGGKAPCCCWPFSSSPLVVFPKAAHT